MDGVSYSALDAQIKQASQFLALAVSALESAREIVSANPPLARALSIAITHAQTAELWLDRGKLMVIR